MKLIAIAGNATCGKDTMCRGIGEFTTAYRRIAFADYLKFEVDSFLKETVGISAWTSDAAEKKVIRPFLVFWGTDFRRGQDPAYWINAAQKDMTSDSRVYIVTDLRFHNEYEWVKANGGVVLYLDRVDSDGNLVPPANEYEAVNNKFLKEHADVQCTWKTYDNELERLTYIENNVIPHIQKYLN